jgi:hypothetical protein
MDLLRHFRPGVTGVLDTSWLAAFNAELQDAGGG